MSTHIVRAFPTGEAIAAVAIALIFITLMSFIREPERQKLNAIILAGAGAAYLSGGLGVCEFPFCIIMTFVAYKGLSHYHYIGIGWLLHSGWDLLHHFYGNPIVPFDPSSSAGCCVCDAVLALWFFFNAPNVLDLFKSRIADENTK